MSRPSAVARWVIAAILLVPAALPYANHYFVPDGPRVWPTGFIFQDARDYAANLREHFDTGRFRWLYANGHDWTYDTEHIYFQPWSLAVAVLWQVSGRPDPGLAWVLWGLLAGWVCCRAIVALIEQATGLRSKVDYRLLVVLAWGGGLMAAMNWVYHADTMLLAFCLAGAAALWCLRTRALARAHLSSPANRLWLCPAVITLALTNHDLVVSNPIQPLHFDRGYVLTGLCLLGLPAFRALFEWLDAVRWPALRAATVAGATKARTAIRDKAGVMPPWYIEKNIGIQHYKNDPSLSDEEIAKIAKWADTGAPRGNMADMPAPKVWPDGNNWTIGTPDLIVESPSIEVKANAPDWWGEFEPTKIPLDEDRYVAAVEIREVNDVKNDSGRETAGARYVWHHLIWATAVVGDYDQLEASLTEQAVGWPVHEVGRNADIFDPEAGRLLKSEGEVSSQASDFSPLTSSPLTSDFRKSPLERR